MIREKGIELQERADEVSLEARRRAAELQAQARERTEQLSAQTREKATAMQAKVKQAVDEGKTVATHKKEDLLTTLDEQAGGDESPAEA